MAARGGDEGPESNIGALNSSNRVPFKGVYKGYYQGYYEDLVLGP